MIPLAVPNLSDREAAYLQECIATGFVSSVGPFVTRFEEMVAHASGSAHGVATSAGTAGLHVALVATGVGPGDLVILPTLTFIASANAISHCVARPWLLDISAERWTLDTELLERALVDLTWKDGAHIRHRETNERVAAIMPVHTLGMPAEMDALVALAGRYGLPVIADGAAALGATDHGRSVGQLGADLTVFSFNGNKTVTAGGGGCVVGNDPQLMQLVRHLTTTARSGADYTHDRVGFNYRLTNLQAAVGCAQMERLDEFVARKKAIHSAYGAAFSGLPGVTPFPNPANVEGACWFSGFVIDGDSEGLRARLRDRGIDARPFWKPMHLQPPYAQCPRLLSGLGDSLWRGIVTLPCSTQITDAELDQVIAAVTSELAR